MATRKLKTDKYRNARGGQAALLHIGCSQCTHDVLLYQKDGKGHLHRCYFNRVMEPEVLARACRQMENGQLADARPLCCPSCKSVIGVPMRHSDGRLAFRLRPGTFTKKSA